MRALQVSLADDVTDTVTQKFDFAVPRYVCPALYVRGREPDFVTGSDFVKNEPIGVVPLGNQLM